MKKLLLSAVSMTALAISANAHAGEQMKNEANTTTQVERTQNQTDTPTITTEDVKKGWENTKESVSEAASDVKEGTKEAYQNAKKATQDAYKDIKSAVMDGEEVVATSTFNVMPEMPVSNIIGQPIYDASKSRVGKVKDLIVNKDGDVEMVVIGDGDFTGLGKMVAFKYDIITNRSADGDVIAPLTEFSIDDAVAFSYDREEAGKNIKVIPSDGYSINDLLDGKIVDPKSKELATIDDALIADGELQNLIIGYGQTLGMGGQQVVLNYNDVTPVHDQGAVNLQLNVEKSAKFEVFKNTATKKN